MLHTYYFNTLPRGLASGALPAKRAYILEPGVECASAQAGSGPILTGNHISPNNNRYRNVIFFPVK
jgi:hypothetical protein